MISTDAGVVNRDGNARDAFDKLISSSANYIVVLNDDNTVAGLITKTSMAKAMGEALWGELVS
ncbi:hypothetical protein SDC9_188172 [bioreactor metagenome]|uniref:CBS domain-containing protein n=1 Tax=bioreactor metagenome TaxID=1076179 RepID=A0A645HWR8_9ZZZZ